MAKKSFFQVIRGELGLILKKDFAKTFCYNIIYRIHHKDAG